MAKTTREISRRSASPRLKPAGPSDADKLGMTLEAAHIGYVIEDIRRQTLHVSDVAWRCLGLPGRPTPITCSALAGMAIDAERWREALKVRKRVLASGNTLTSELELRHADDGRQIVMRAHLFPCRNTAKETTHILAVVSDIAETARLQEVANDERRASAYAEELGKIGHFVMDPASGLVSISEGLTRLAGLSDPLAQRSIMRTLGQVFDARQAADLRSRCQRAISTGEGASVELEIQAHGDAGRRTIAVQLEPMRDRAGDVVILFGVVRDVTDHRRAEDDAATTNRLLLRADALGEIGHFVNDFRERRTYYSPKMSEIFGVPPLDASRLGSNKLAGYVPSKAIDDFEAAGKRAVAIHAAGYSHTFRFKRVSDGARRTVNVETSFDYDPSGRLKTSFGLVRDVTNLQTVERQFAFRDQFYNLAQRLGRMAYWHFDVDAREIYWSDSMYELFGVGHGVDVRTGLDRFASALPDAEARSFALAGVKAIRNRADQYEWTLNIVRPSDNAARVILANTSITYGDGRRPVAILGVIQDITEQVREREERETLQRAVAEANRIEALNYFAGGLGHELANMLQPALSYGDLARSALDSNDVEAAKSFVDGLTRAIERARELTRETLTFVKMEAREAAPMPLGDALEPSRTFLGFVSRGVEWKIPEEILRVPVLAEPDGMLQILLNFVRNSITAAGDEVAISITARKSGDGTLVLSVADDGPGLSPEQLEQLLDISFKRSRSGQKVGLGLPISGGIAERWGAAIDAENGRDGGAVFRLSLKIAA